MDKIVLRLSVKDVSSLQTYEVVDVFGDSLVSFKDGYSTMTMNLKYLEPKGITKNIGCFDIWCLCYKDDIPTARELMSAMVMNIYDKFRLELLESENETLSLLEITSYK